MAVISIHAPQWGATCLSDGHVADLIISIHAPQWGATHRRWTGESLSLNFNPRTPVGCDLRTRPATCWTRYFNPRTPVGCDGGIRQADARTRNFNPRTPVGCDRPVRGCVYGFAISIHAPQWGATHSACLRSCTSYHFNPRTPVGCDTTVEPCGHIVVISIHAPQWGATAMPLCFREF